MKTTLNKIRLPNTFEDDWEKLLKYLNKTSADDEPLSISTIIDSNGVDYALWCLRGVEGHDREIRLYSVWCARQVQHLMTDKRSIDALDVAEKYANGLASKEELDLARISAWDAEKEAWAAGKKASSWAAAAAVPWPDASVSARSARFTAIAASAISEKDIVQSAQEKELRRICFAEGEQA
jgi:hypothetical protein